MSEESNSRELALHYMETLVDVARESFLILDSNIRVISANPMFYETFKTTPGQTENRLLYELGNGQWNIEELKTLLENILPNKKVVRDYEVTHTFEAIGLKTMELNAREIDTVQLIILAIEDVTVRINLEVKLSQSIKELEAKVEERTQQLNNKIKDLELANKSMVGRELKMIDLKKEIKGLEEEVGRAKN
jgi:two-component system CheB/CheR fusion protein